MNKKPQITEYDGLYKRLTKIQFINIMENMRMLNCALAHIAFACSEKKKGNVLQIPLINHADHKFQFQVLKNKETKEEVLEVKIVEKDTKH